MKWILYFVYVDIAIYQKILFSKYHGHSQIYNYLNLVLVPHFFLEFSFYIFNCFILTNHYFYFVNSFYIIIISNSFFSQLFKCFVININKYFK